MDQLEEITKSMTYTTPKLGDNVLKYAKLIRICGNVGCAKPVYVTEINNQTGRTKYSCPVHGDRKFSQMDWMDITGSTMLEFRKVGLNA